MLGVVTVVVMVTVVLVVLHVNSFGGGGGHWVSGLLERVAVRRGFGFRCGDSLGDELGVVLDPAYEGRPSRVLPRETEEVQAGYVRHAAVMRDSAVRPENPGLDPRVVGAVARRPDDRVDVKLVPSAKVTLRPSASTTRGFSSTPYRRSSSRGLEPISVSRCCNRRPSRDSTVFSISPVLVSHQKRSRPNSFCGSGFCREPTARWTLCVAESSFAIW